MKFSSAALTAATALSVQYGAVAHRGESTTNTRGRVLSKGKGGKGKGGSFECGKGGSEAEFLCAQQSGDLQWAIRFDDRLLPYRPLLCLPSGDRVAADEFR